jgi:hypothetical protein
MKAEFEFDGDSLRIFLKVEDRCEVALARVIEKYNRATVSLSYSESGMYSYRHNEDPKGVSIILREAPKCPQTGTWCSGSCAQSRDCQAAPVAETDRG